MQNGATLQFIAIRKLQPFKRYALLIFASKPVEIEMKVRLLGNYVFAKFIISPKLMGIKTLYLAGSFIF